MRGRAALSVLLAGLASCVTSCVVAPALATMLHCRPSPIGSPPNDPQYAVTETTVEFGATGWRIEHRLANGNIVARSSQYTMQDTSTDRSTEWRGQYNRNPNLVMIGDIVKGPSPSSLIYRERIYDTSRGNELVGNTQADCVVQAALPPQPAAPPTQPAPDSPNRDAEDARDRLLKEAIKQYDDCAVSQMKLIVPYSNESAETIAQVIVTNCSPLEQHNIDLGMAIYGASRADVENIIRGPLEDRKKKIVAAIVTFRAEVAKTLMSQPKDDNLTEKKKDMGL